MYNIISPIRSNFLIVSTLLREIEIIALGNRKLPFQMFFYCAWMWNTIFQHYFVPFVDLVLNAAFLNFLLGNSYIHFLMIISNSISLLKGSCAKRWKSLKISYPRLAKNFPFTFYFFEAAQELQKPSISSKKKSKTSP